MIEIGVNNAQELSEYKLVDGKYEYKKIPLQDLQSKYIYIPLSVILDTELDVKRVGVFSYLRVYCGLNNIINFTVPDIVEWCGGKPDRRVNGINDKVLSTINDLGNKGYLTYLTETSKSSYMKSQFNIEYYFSQCHNGFSVIYLDEIETIMNYKKINSKDNTVNNFAILLVFAYLRQKIWRRPNELKPEERYPDEIKNRRERFPDAFNSSIKDIENDLKISSKTLSKIIDILEYDLNLIVTDRAYRTKNKDGEFRTLPTIFANAYKREDKYLLVTGENYSRAEIELKANNMKRYYQGYQIDKRKRKNNVERRNDCETPN